MTSLTSQTLRCPTMTEEEFDDLQVKLNAYKEYRDDPQADVTEWERGFMDDQLKRVEEYGTRARFSDKQMEIIDRVYGKMPL